MPSAQIIDFMRYSTIEPMPQIKTISTPSTPCFFSAAEVNNSLSSVFLRGYSIFMELVHSDDLSQLDNTLEGLLAQKPDICMSLLTATCYNLAPASDIANMLASRFGIPYEKSSNIQTCLQEVIMNSVFHGNLQVPKHFRTIDDFEKYQTEFTRRLTDDKLRHKRVNILVWNESQHIKIAVSDEGNGLKLPEKIDEKTTSHSLEGIHGRGLMFVRSLSSKMWMGDDHKTLYMFFNK